MTDQIITLRVEDQLSAGARAAETALDRVGASAERTESKVAAATRSAGALAGRYDDVTRAASRLSRAEAELAAAKTTLQHGLETGTISADQHARTLGALESRVVSARRAAAELAGTLDTGARSSAGAQVAVRNLGMQMFDVVPQLASGANVMTTLVQQGGQVAQMAAATGTSLGALARGAVGAVLGINPLVLVAAAATAGLAAIGTAAEVADRRLAASQNAIRALRTDYEGLAQVAERAARTVAQTGGLSTSEARGAATALVARPEFVGTQRDLEGLIRTAEDLAARLGIPVSEAAGKMAAGMRDAAALARELEGRLAGFDSELTRTVTLQDRAGQGAAAFATVLDRLRVATEGASEQALTPLGKSVRDLSNEFTRVGDDGKSLAEALGSYVTRAASAALDAITALVGGLESLRQQANRPSERAPTPTGLRRGVLGAAALMAQAEGAAVFDSVAAQSSYSADILTFGRATMIAESRGVQGAVSPAGAIGLMGLMPGTAQGLGVDPTDARQNVTGGLRYISDLWAKYGGDADLVAMAYNWGPGNVDRFLASSRRLADVPRETRAHVMKVTGGDLSQFDLPLPPVPPNETAAGGPVQISASRIVDAALSRATAGPTADRQGAAADVRAYTEALAVLAAQGETTGDRVGRLRDMLADANKRLAEAVPATTRVAQGMADQVGAADRLTRAYGQGYAAVREVTAATRAEQEARQTVGRGAPGYIALVAELTARYVDLAEAQGRTAAATRVLENQDALALIEAERAALGENSKARAEMLAGLRAEQELKRLGVSAESDLGRAYVDSAVQIARATQELDLHKRALDSVVQGVTSAADTIAGAITGAFVQGSGAAVNWGNVARGAAVQVANVLGRLGLVNPVLNTVLGGEQRPTLWDAVGAAGASTGRSGLLGTASNVLSLARLGDTLGLTDIGGRLSSVGQYLGLTGDGGLLSGVNGLLGATLFEGPAGSLAMLGGAEFGTAAGAVAGAPVSIGQALGPAGIGFAGGSLLGGALQRTFNRTGPAPTIGAGLGALAGVPLIPFLGPLAPIVGGLLGGGAGSLIGPRPASAYSSTAVTVGADGLLGVGQTAAQIVDPSGEISALTQQVAQLNSVMAAFGIQIANGTSVDPLGQTRLIGGRSGTWLSTGTGGGRPSDLSGAWGEFRFTSGDDMLARALAGKEFAGPEALAAAAQEVVSFVNEIAPAMLALGKTTKDYGIGSLTTQLDALRQQFDSAIETARKLGHQESELTSAREAAIAAAERAPIEALTRTDQGFTARYFAARAVNTGDSRMALDAALQAFDIQATAERDAFSDTLLTMLGEAGRTSSLYADQMLQLDRVLGEERLTLLKRYNDSVLATEQETARQRETAAARAGGLVSSLADYADSLATGPQSGLSAAEQYAAARAAFTQASTAAAAGDAMALGGLQSVTDRFLAASRPINGTGAGYARDFAEALDALRRVARLAPDTLTQSVFTLETRSAAQSITDALGRVNAALTRIEQNAALARLTPAR